MPVMIRKEETLQEIEKLKKELNFTTATSVIDFVVSEYQAVFKGREEAEAKARKLNQDIKHIKTVLAAKKQADKEYSALFDNL